MMIMSQAWAIKEVGGASHFTNWICTLYGKLTFRGVGEGGPWQRAKEENRNHLEKKKHL